MRYLALAEVVELHRRLLEATGGAPGIRDLGALESAIAQPKATFGGVDLYPTLEEKAAALGLSLVQDHPFVDGNKRVGHAAMETFLVRSGTRHARPGGGPHRSKPAHRLVASAPQTSRVSSVRSNAPVQPPQRAPRAAVGCSRR